MDAIEMRMILDPATRRSAANRRVPFGGIPCKRCQHHGGCAYMVDVWTTISRLVSNTSRLFQLLNKFGNSVVCDVFAMFPVKLHCTLATYVWRLLDHAVL
jgi:hypothetical protein